MIGGPGKTSTGRNLNRAGVSTRPGVFYGELSSSAPSHILLNRKAVKQSFGKRGFSEAVSEAQQKARLAVAGLRHDEITDLIIEAKVSSLVSKYWLCDTRFHGCSGPTSSFDEFVQCMKGLNLLLTTIHSATPGAVYDKDLAWKADEFGLRQLCEALHARIREDESDDEDADSVWHGAGGMTVLGATQIVLHISRTVEKSVTMTSILVATLLNTMSLQLDKSPTPEEVAAAYSKAPDWEKFQASFHPAQDWATEVLQSPRYLNLRSAPGTPIKRIRFQAEEDAEPDEKAADTQDSIRNYCCFAHVKNEECEYGDDCHFGHPDPSTKLFKDTLARSKKSWQPTGNGKWGRKGKGGKKKQ